MPESTHTYEQTNKELTVLVPLPSADVRAKEIEWRCTTAEVRVRARGADLLCGSFFKPVKPDDSTWEIEDAPGGGRRLRLGLVKARANEKWECLMRDEVDTTVTSRVFLDLSIGGAPLGRVTLGLYGNAAPRTAENFRCLCTGERGSVRRKKSDVRLHYKGTSFHRIVPNFLCQGGDVTHDPDGAGGQSIYGRTFDDEGFRVRHEGAGELIMAHMGVANNNGSQFAVTLARVTEFESGYIVFGKVLEGMALLQQAQLEGSADGYTARRVGIDDCGELDARGEAIEEVATAAAERPEAEVAAEEELDGLVLEEQ